MWRSGGSNSSVGFWYTCKRFFFPHTGINSMGTNLSIMWNVLTICALAFSWRCVALLLFHHMLRLWRGGWCLYEKESDDWVIYLSQQELIHLAWYHWKPYCLCVFYCVSRHHRPKEHPHHSVPPQLEPAEEVNQNWVTDFRNLIMEIQQGSLVKGNLSTATKIMI